MGKHAYLSPSAGERWINCPPSAKENAEKNDTSPYAEYGTSAHALAEAKLKKALGYNVRDPTEDLEYFDEEMDEFTNEYRDFILEQVETVKQKCSDPIVLVEQHLDLSRWVPECYGTADCVIVADDKINIYDLKTGVGILVSAEDNAQLKLYSLGVINLFESLYDIQSVRMTIYQPRRDNISTDEISLTDLLSWADEVLIPAAELAFKGEGEYKAGKHCQFCKIKATCRKRAEYNMQMAKYDFAVPNTLTDTEIGMILERADTFIGWMNDVKEYALEQAIAGKNFIGFKVVEGRSNRKFTDENAVASAVTNAGYDPFEKKLMGVTAMTKLLGKKKFDTLLGSFVVKPKGKPTLVPQSDKRPAWTIDDFKEEK